MKSLIGLHLLFGPLLLVIGVLFRFLPPKRRNYLYGYRTPRSMRSDDTWKAANRYSADRMIACSVIVFAMQLLSLAVFGPAISLPVAAAAIMSGMTWVIISTERYLKRTFDDAGEKRH